MCGRHSRKRVGRLSRERGNPILALKERSHLVMARLPAIHWFPASAGMTIFSSQSDDFSVYPKNVLAVFPANAGIQSDTALYAKFRKYFSSFLRPKLALF